jgi:RNA 2',3'-cyclic 3'-phosphodiesterase
VRLFFALWPEDKAARHFAHAASQLRLESSARLVDGRNYHLTLAFVGEVDARNVGELRRIGGTRRASCCNIDFTAVEYWPDPQVVVGTAEEIPAALECLSAELHKAASPYRRKPAAAAAPRLRGHVTLARKVAQAPVLPTMSSFTWPVHHFSLVSSDTSGSESVYTVLDTWPLLYEK